MLFVNGNDFDISSVWESSKKIPVWIKYGERGKVKGAKFIYRLRGRGPLIFRGGIFRFLGGGEVGSVFAIKWLMHLIKCILSETKLSRAVYLSELLHF